MELNDHGAVIVGLCEIALGFQSQPVVCGTYAWALNLAPIERKNPSFMLFETQRVKDPVEVTARIRRITGLEPIRHSNSSIGTLVAGQTFYNFTMDGSVARMGELSGRLERCRSRLRIRLNGSSIRAR
jgi:putative ABC transport system permease protein